MPRGDITIYFGLRPHNSYYPTLHKSEEKERRKRKQRIREKIRKEKKD